MRERVGEREENEGEDRELGRGRRMRGECEGESWGEGGE